MLRNTFVLCIALATCTLPGYSQSAAADSFTGTWHPVGSPDGFSRVAIERSGAGFTVEVWSECFPADCSWGISAGEPAADGNSLTAKFSPFNTDLGMEFALLTDGSLQVTTELLHAGSRKKSDLDDIRVAYLTKGHAELPFTLLIPAPLGKKQVPQTIETPAPKVSEASDVPHCTVVLDPPAVMFDRAGGDVSVAVHAPPACAWADEGGVEWLSATQGRSGTGEGRVVLHASPNDGDPRAGAVTIGGTGLPAVQSGFDRDWNFPGLSCGSNSWSTVRITNAAPVPRPVRIDVYKSSGDRLPLDPVFSIGPQETVEVVIETRRVEIYRRSAPRPDTPEGPRVLEASNQDAAAEDGYRWAKIAQASEQGMPNLDVRASVEVLKGNQVSEFKREPQEPHYMAGTMTVLASRIRGRLIYFLNLSDGPATVTFCAANKIQGNPCSKKESSPAHALVRPNQFITVNVKNLAQRYFFVDSSHPGKMILGEFVPAQGTTKVFSSESSINFGEPER